MGMVVIHLLMALVEPPAKLPDLFTVACCGYSFVHFAGFWLYFQYQQLSLPSEISAGREKQQHAHAE